MATREKEGSVTLDKEQAAYEAQREELERNRKGDWVIFHDEKLIGNIREFPGTPRRTRLISMGSVLI